jgi:glucose-1-phosphate adenylyltransferase
MEQKRRVYGYKHQGYWGYTRTIEEYWQTNMDLLGENPKIDMEKWGVRTNLAHRGICDVQPTLIGKTGKVQNSMIYNGCVVDGEVRNSILFPGVQVKKGAVIESSVLFFNNKIGENCCLNRVVADVNSIFEKGVCAGPSSEQKAEQITVIGWNNHIPAATVIEQGATIYPQLSIGQWKQKVSAGEVLR